MYNSIINGLKEVNEKDQLTISYEEMCDDPLSLYLDVLGFLSLENTDQFVKYLGCMKFENNNYKYKKDLTNKQIDELKEQLQNYLN